MHTIVAVDAAGKPLRVACGFCRAEHNYRGGKASSRSSSSSGSGSSAPRRSARAAAEPAEKPKIFKPLNQPPAPSPWAHIFNRDTRPTTPSTTPTPTPAPPNARPSASSDPDESEDDQESQPRLRRASVEERWGAPVSARLQPIAREEVAGDEDDELGVRRRAQQPDYEDDGEEDLADAGDAEDSDDDDFDVEALVRNARAAEAEKAQPAAARPQAVAGAVDADEEDDADDRDDDDDDRDEDDDEDEADSYARDEEDEDEDDVIVPSRARVEAVSMAAEPRVRAAVPEERMAPVQKADEMPDDLANLEWLIRKVIREETGLTTVTPAPKWRGGQLVLKPGRADLQEKSWPIETFFHKVVMLRNRLRTLEQQINAMPIPEDEKVKLQTYVTGCYGSLTSFNVLFADLDDMFKGSGGE